MAWFTDAKMRHSVYRSYCEQGKQAEKKHLFMYLNAPVCCWYRYLISYCLIVSDRKLLIICGNVVTQAK